ncbi:sant swi3, ada2, n-cor and tfiiib dna-binding domain-containing [Trichoderma arundinaceum]|uniref:Sant swi3, ada2, n-cor and tfiiib dna-binding domain-containing n=1 Tax=Trichoderma arundinaceum TaxID=490622 RepID=A0A395P0U9_TRIAR|nr:sant swi3, ada2, n-cor and tfiiib dna-binding domain-containing [Trichoderma arundinaceum]
MQTRRSKKAAEAAVSSPLQPASRRNPPRRSTRRAAQAVVSNSVSSSSPSPSPSSSPTRLRSSPPHPPHSQVTPSLPRQTPSPVLPALPKGLTSVPRKGSIVFDPKPRRGAPRHLSVSSIATNPKKDYTDDEDHDQTSVLEPKSPADILAEEMAQREIEETELQMKLEAIPSLARDAKNVIDQFQNKNTRVAYQKVLHMKLQSFMASRSIFISPRQESPFLDWEWMDKAELDIPGTAKATVPLAIKLANIATALDQIQSIESEGHNPVPFLEAIDACFPRHFASEQGKEYLSLSLELRTQLAIEGVARSPQTIDLRGMLGHAFCIMKSPNTPSEYGKLFQSGPYKPLAGLDEESLRDVCSDRVLQLWNAMSEGGKKGIRTPVDLPSTRAQFPLQDMLAALKKWLLARYATISKLLVDAEQEEIAREKQRLQEQWRAEEELRMREEQAAREEERRAREEELRVREEAQQARDRERRAMEEDRARKERQARLGTSRRGERAREQSDGNDLPPLPDEDSLPYYDAPEMSSQSLTSSQPEPSRRIQRREKAPEDGLVGLLGNVSLSRAPVSGRSGQWLPDSEASRKRPRQQDNQSRSEEEEDDDDDDDFEEDQRPIKRIKATSSSAPTSRPQQQQREPRNPTASAATSSAPALPSSSMPDFAAIQRVKALARINARLNQPQSLKKRFVWSDRDSATLIELIAHRAAGWATIDREDSHRFELPRNAQAYRDRARNMKVDFLISDAVLPQGFDLVTLSKKEIDRLQKLGKNHERRESDVDRNGRPTNTEAVLL